MSDFPMTMEFAMQSRKFQIFVSSVQKDLKEEREAVYEAIRDSGNIPAGMEAFVSTSKEQFEVIKEHIDKSDCVVVILAARYGSINDDTGVSYTEMEYDYAKETGKEVISLILKEDSLPEWTERKSSKLRMNMGDFFDDSQRTKQFKEKLQERSIVKYWSSDMDIKYEANRAISYYSDHVEEKHGWIKASFIHDFKREIDQRGRYIEEKDSTIEYLESKIRALESEANYSAEIEAIESGKDFILAIEKAAFNMNITSSDAERELRVREFKKAIVAFRQRLEDKEKGFALISSGDIERVGDICRQNGYSDQAYWLYERAVKRNENNRSAQIEFLCLKMDRNTEEREAAYQSLVEISKECAENEIMRIFNGLIDIDKYAELENLCTSILINEGKLPPKLRAIIYRNRAVGRRHRGGIGINNGAIEDIQKAMELDPHEENNIKVYASFLRDRGDFESASKQFAALIRIDPRDISYYIGLIQCFQRLKRNDFAKIVLSKAMSVSNLQDKLKLQRLESELSAIPQNNEIEDLLSSVGLTEM